MSLGQQWQTSYFDPGPDLHYDAGRISTLTKAYSEKAHWKISKPDHEHHKKNISTWLKSTYALQHLASCSQEIEKKLLVTPLTLCLILKKKKEAPREQNSVRFELLPNIKFQTVPNVAALTFAEIHTPPQVVKVRLPDLHVICCLNETRIQRLLKNVWGKDRKNKKIRMLLLLKVNT